MTIIALGAILSHVVLAAPPPAKVATPKPATPRPIVSTTPKPVKRSGAEFRLKSGKPEALVLRPVLRGGGKPEPTIFELSKSGKGVILAFKSRDPKLTLAPERRLAIHVFAEPPYELEPSLITSTDWPKGSLQMTLNLTGGAITGPVNLDGKASYTVCHKETKNCYPVKAQSFYLTYLP